MADPLNPERDFSSLSVLDLLEARNAYHVHLAHMEHVVATAIGRFWIRNSDPDARNPNETAPAVDGTRRASRARTLQNSTITRWSWPCVLVFVDHWMSPEEWRDRPDDVVPSFLYMPDGRIVPTCVVLVEEQEQALPALPGVTFPSELIGGGFPVLTDSQGREHIGSIGCLVTDGDAIYALTNRHVTGPAGRPIYSMLRGERVQIGVSDEKQIGKLPFAKAYPGWPDTRAFANLDAGLIRVDDLADWTAQVFGIGEIGPPIDLNTSTLSLDLIGSHVRAFGCASGQLSGRVQALFYRYRSIGGVDYEADVLIGGREDGPPLTTRPGDSGTLWFFDPEKDEQRQSGLRAPRLRPIALQWGGHRLLDSATETELRFALATYVSTISRELDVELIRDWNIGLAEYWGTVGHYTVGALACDLVPEGKLRTLIDRNRDRIALSRESLGSGQLPALDPEGFVPLANVADLVWRASRPKDSGNHFADMDEEGRGEFAGTTLLELCENDANVTVARWNRFYDSLDIGTKRGALPFRIWQIYQDMVGFARERDVARFLCAGGIMAHYVGDACQPLHASFLHHGRPGHPEEERVHSVYETSMIERRAAELIAGVLATLEGQTASGEVCGGHGAAVAVVDLLRQTITTLPPMDVIEAFNGATGAARIPHMWEVLGDRTVTCIAAGCHVLASLWISAWKEGEGDDIPANRLKAIDLTSLKQLYNNKEFLPALRLQEFEETGLLV